MFFGIWMFFNGCVEEISEGCRRGVLIFVVDGVFFFGLWINCYYVVK